MRKAVAAAAGVLLVVIASAAAYLSLVPIDLTPHLPRVKEMLERRVAGRVDAERLVIKALPSPEITVEGLSTSLGGSPIFGAPLVRVRVSLLPLLLGHVVLEDLELHGANIFLRRDEDGAVNILEFLKASREVRERNGARRSIAVKLMNITDTQVEITDRLPGEPVEFDITGIKGVIRMTEEGLAIEAAAHLAPDTGFTFSGGETREGAWGRGSLRGLRLERFSPYLREAVKGASMEGAVDLDFTWSGKRDKRLEGTLAYGSVSVDLPEFLTSPLASGGGSATISMAPDGRGPAFSVKDADIDLGEFHVKGEFSLSGGRGERSFSLELSTTPVPLAYAAGLVRKEALPALHAEKLSYIEPLKGTVAVKRLSASGPLRFSGRPAGAVAVGLDAAVEGVSLKYRGLKRPFEDIFASVSYGNRTLKVSEAGGRYGKSVLEEFQAAVSGLPDRPAYDAEAKAAIDLGEAAALVSGLVRNNRAAGEFLSKTDLQGSASVTAKAKGPLKDGLSSARYSGKAEVRNGELSYRGLPLRLRAISASAGFDNKAIEIKELKASEGGSTLSVTGTINGYLGKAPSFNIMAEGSVADATLTRAAANRPLGKAASFKGNIPFAVKASGSFGSFAADAFLDAKAASIRYGGIVDKRAGANLSLAVSAGLSGRTAEIRKAGLKFGDGSSIAVSGKAALDASSYDLKIGSGRVLFADMDEVSPYFSRDFDSGGTISLDVSAVKASEKAAPSLSGEAGVKDARFRTRLLARPVEDIDARASFSGNTGLIAIENLSVGRTRAMGYLDIEDIAQRTVMFELASPGLYTSDLVPEKEGGEEAKAAPKKPANKPATKHQDGGGPALNGRGSINIAAGELFGHHFKDLRAEVNIDRKTIRAGEIEMSIDHGSAAGMFTFHRSPSAPKLFESVFTFKGLDTKTMLDGFGAKKEYITGTFGAEVELSARRGASPFTAGLNGKASFRSVKGRMWKVPVITEIFSIVNILSIDELWRKGLPYKTVSGGFTMKDGVASTEAIEMESDSMRMSAAGEISLPEQRMDMVVAMRPFVTIDKIISNIPLAGWIITGKDESTVSMYFGVKGPLKNPTVLPKPITGISKGVFGILQRIIEAPVEILRGEVPGAEEKEKRP